MRVGTESVSEFLISIVLTPISCSFTTLNSCRICYCIDRAVSSCVVWGALPCFRPRGSTAELQGYSTKPSCPWSIGLKFLPSCTSSSGMERVQGRENCTFACLPLSHLFPTRCELFRSILPDFPWHVQDSEFVNSVKQQTKEKKYGSKVTVSEESLKKNC